MLAVCSGRAGDLRGDRRRPAARQRGRLSAADRVGRRRRSLPLRRFPHGQRRHRRRPAGYGHAGPLRRAAAADRHHRHPAGKCRPNRVRPVGRGADSPLRGGLFLGRRSGPHYGNLAETRRQRHARPSRVARRVAAWRRDRRQQRRGGRAERDHDLCRRSACRHARRRHGHARFRTDHRPAPPRAVGLARAGLLSRRRDRSALQPTAGAAGPARPADRPAQNPLRLRRG